jgi:hypothetical protein
LLNNSPLHFNGNKRRKRSENCSTNNYLPSLPLPSTARTTQKKVYNIGDFHQLKRKKKFETKKDWRKKSAVFALKKLFLRAAASALDCKKKQQQERKKEEGGQPSSSSTGRTYNPPPKIIFFFIQNLF